MGKPNGWKIPEVSGEHEYNTCELQCTIADLLLPPGHEEERRALTALSMLP